TPGPGGALVRRGANRTRGRARYRPTKATQCGGTGGRRSERLESPVEAGELAPEDPAEGSEASGGRPDRGKHAEQIKGPPHAHGTRAESHGDPSGMANLSAEEPDARMRARPGLWERWGATPSATRPVQIGDRVEVVLGVGDNLRAAKVRLGRQPPPVGGRGDSARGSGPTRSPLSRSWP